MKIFHSKITEAYLRGGLGQCPCTPFQILRTKIYKNSDFETKYADFWDKNADFCDKNADFWDKYADFWNKNADFWDKNADFWEPKLVIYER